VVICFSPKTRLAVLINILHAKKHVNPELLHKPRVIAQLKGFDYGCKKKIQIELKTTIPIDCSFPINLLLFSVSLRYIAVNTA